MISSEDLKIFNRIASGADDGLIVLWHIVTGERVGVLKGHLLPITCLMLLERYKLISGSADKCIRVRFFDIKSPPTYLQLRFGTSNQELVFEF